MSLSICLEKQMTKEKLIKYLLLFCPLPKSDFGGRLRVFKKPPELESENLEPDEECFLTEN